MAQQLERGRRRTRPSAPGLAAALLLGSLLVAFGTDAPCAVAAPPWEGTPLAGDPKAFLAAAAAATAGDSHDAVVLLEEGRYSFDAEGRCHYTYRFVYRLQSQKAVGGWATTEAGWAPWHEERPRISARVVTPDGRAHVLDPATVAETPYEQEDGQVFSDRRRLVAPLPAVQVGAVVEELIETQDRTPFFAMGNTYRFYIGSASPVRVLRVTVDAPSGLPLHYALRGTEGVTVDRAESDGRVRLRLEVGPLAPVKSKGALLPADSPRRPYLAFSTGRSWAAVASVYSSIVDAQVGAASPVALRAGVKREEVATRLVQQVHQEVRYTGVEFGEAAIIPRRPEEVLSRRYGDCKDKAVLLVSRLRAAGVPAYVALLFTGPGPDLDADLPGLGSFDHVIVVLPGTPTLWIDATAEFARVNALPAADQDRLVLVAAPGTSSLGRTPASTSSDNRIVRVREYRLAASGQGQLTETTEVTGSPEIAFRSYYATGDAAEIRKALDSYFEREHGAPSLTKVDTGSPRDLAKPWRLRLESDRIGNAVTEGSKAVVRIPVGGLFSRLPDPIGNSEEQGPPSLPRKEPAILFDPYSAEWRFRVIPPAGFALRSLPQAVKEPLGRGTFEVSFAASPNGAVEGRVAFDSGPRLIDPGSFEALHKGVRKWLEHDPLEVVFEDRAQALLDQGKTCEGLLELRAAAAATPGTAARLRLVNALIAAGFGDAARDEARRAVSLEPTSSSASRTLGWVLEHDLVGRRFKAGCDRPGAEAAYRKAIQLDPKDLEARASLAILFEHDDAGVHFGPTARFSDAIAEIRALRTDSGRRGLDLNLALDLVHARQFAEAETLLRSMPRNPNNDEVLLVAVAAQRGADAAIAEAAKLMSEVGARRDALLHAGNTLISLRRYPEGARLVDASAAGADDAAVRRQRGALFARVRRCEDVPAPADPTIALVKRFYETMAGIRRGNEPLAALQRLWDPGERHRKLASDETPAGREGLLAFLGRLSHAGRFEDLELDIVWSIADTTVEGSRDGGQRVILNVAGNKIAFHLAPGASGPRLVFGEEAFANQALRLLDKSNLAGARQWLNWARELIGESEAFAGHPFAQLWRPGGPDGPDAVRLAAAALADSKARLAASLQILTAGRGLYTPGVDRDAVDYAILVLSLALERSADAVPISERLLAAHPESKPLLGLRLLSLRSAGRDAETRAFLEQRLRRNPGDAAALRSLAQVALGAGQLDEAERTYARIAALGQVESGDLNNRAWLALLRSRVDDTAIEWARQATRDGHSAALHTLASLYAEVGRVGEARQILTQRLANEPGGAIGPEDWYVFGRLAETCGFADAARLAYTRVETETRKDSTFVLAQRRLAGLPRDVSARQQRR